MLGYRLSAGDHFRVHVAVKVRGLAVVLGEDRSFLHQARMMRSQRRILYGVLLAATVALEYDDAMFCFEVGHRRHVGRARGRNERAFLSEQCLG